MDTQHHGFELKFTKTSDPAISYVTASNVPEYYLKLMNFIKGLLSPIMDENRLRYYFPVEDSVTGKPLNILPRDPFPIWIQAFTHETFDANTNWEVLEFKGDALFRYLIPKHIAAMKPGLTHAEYSALYIFYSSATDQERLARELGFGHFFRSMSYDADSNMIADALEGFMGAFDEISEMIEKGSGAILGYELVKRWYPVIKTDMVEAQGAPKTQVEQYFPDNKVDKESYVENGDTVFRVLIPYQKVQYLMSLGFDLSGLPDYKGSKLAGEGRARTKKGAEAEAFMKALENMKNIGGLTKKKFETSKEEKKIRLAVGLDREAEFMAKLEKLGYTNPRLEKPTKTSTKKSRIIQFVVFDTKTNQTKILCSVKIQGSDDQEKVEGQPKAVDQNKEAYRLLIDKFMSQ